MKFSKSTKSPMTSLHIESSLYGSSNANIGTNKYPLFKMSREDGAATQWDTPGAWLFWPAPTTIKCMQFKLNSSRDWGGVVEESSSGWEGHSEPPGSSCRPRVLKRGPSHSPSWRNHLTAGWRTMWLEPWGIKFTIELVTRRDLLGETLALLESFPLGVPQIAIISQGISGDKWAWWRDR